MKQNVRFEKHSTLAFIIYNKQSKIKFIVQQAFYALDNFLFFKMLAIKNSPAL